MQDFSSMDAAIGSGWAVAPHLTPGAARKTRFFDLLLSAFALKVLQTLVSLHRLEHVGE
jgi:hypothetical protein